jgi:hypothetical protein
MRDSLKLNRSIWLALIVAVAMVVLLIAILAAQPEKIDLEALGFNGCLTDNIGTTCRDKEGRKIGFTSVPGSESITYYRMMNTQMAREVRNSLATITAEDSPVLFATPTPIS